MNRNNIDMIAKNADDRILLAKLWDKIQTGIRKNIPSNTAFLSPREQEMARFLFGDSEGLFFFGGYEEAERKALLYLPDYLEKDSVYEDGPLCCLRASFYGGDTPTHRDFLGALMGAGIARETVGDICVGKGECIFFVTNEISSYILQNFTDVGRTKVHLVLTDMKALQLPQPEVKEIRDTLASLRLDSVISTGFRIGRSQAAQLIAAGKAAINGLPCEKPDKSVEESAKVSVRGLGKICLRSVGGQTKKGRISVIIDRYM